jgi:hypothetical protein
MQDPLSLLGEVLPHTPWVAALFIVRSVLVRIRAHLFVTDLIDRARLASTIRRLLAHGASKKEIRRVIRDDHDARVGRSP